MPTRLHITPKGPLEQAMILSSAANNTGNNPATSAMHQALIGATPSSTIQTMSGLGGKRLPLRPPQPAQSTFGSFAPVDPTGWSTAGHFAEMNSQGINAPTSWQNTAASQQPKSYDFMGAGIAKPGQQQLGTGSSDWERYVKNRMSAQNLTAEQQTALPTRPAQNYLNNPSAFPSYDNLVPDTFQGTYTSLVNPVTIVPEVPGAKSYVIDNVKYYDPSIDNKDAEIKNYIATGALPDDWDGVVMSDSQWQAVQDQAPGDYYFTPWGWVSTDYINSLTGTASTGGYDYGGYSWGGGGGGGRSKLDQFYFGLMNWGI